MGPTVGVDADVIVVGGGLGGAAAALRLTERGVSVLVLEAGPDADVATVRRSRLERLLDRATKRPVAPDPTRAPYYVVDRDGGDVRRAPVALGRGVGGSSQFYASALGRFKRSDFAEARPGRSAEPALPNAWPIDYDTFCDYYDRAEALMTVRGDRDPLDPDDPERPGRPLPPLTPSAVDLRDRLRHNGLHPYRLHVGIDYAPGCGECFQGRCPRACKADGNNRLLVRALATGRARLEVGATVQEVAVEDGTVRIVVRDEAGTRSERRAARLVLAAGALETPLLLDRSAGLWQHVPRPALLGRGLMFHITDTWAVGTRGDTDVPQKWLGLRDFYDDGVHDLGEIQSTGFQLSASAVERVMRGRLRRRPSWLARALGALVRPAAWVTARVLGARPVLATIAEDLPHERNRVWAQDGRVVVDYAVDPMLRDRAPASRAQLRKVFAPYRLRFTAAPAEPNWGHPMGTCRMGADAATSVTTPDGRLRGHEQIFVADASIFPSSGGTGPGLTVVALALRVADHVADALPARTAASQA